MYFWSSFPLVRITLYFIGGILWAYYKALSYEILLLSTSILIILYIIIVVILRRIVKWYIVNHWIGLLGLINFWFLGALCFSHYKNYNISINKSPVDWEAYVAVAVEESMPKEDGMSVIVSVQRVCIDGNWKKKEGKVKLYVSKSSIPIIEYGDVYLVRGYPKSITVPLNPKEFNYKSFLAYENIYYQHAVAKKDLLKITNKPPNYLKLCSLKIRKYCKNTIRRYMRADAERSIVLTLVLGIKDELEEIGKAYANAGTMHVLAVSGLHVGILYWLLSFILYRRNKNYQKEWLRAIILCVGLWIYAAITGLAPSVLRATWMFSLVVFAKMFDRVNNIYNSLAFSAFLLLAYKPVFLFSVSFQLSYIAVLGIIYLQPKIYNWFCFENYIVHKLWLWTSVSLAAQLVTTPITVYYFHQFPNYFIIANWIVVPAAFLIFVLGIGILVTSFWPFLSHCIAFLLKYVTWLVNKFVIYISELPYSVWKDIYISVQSLILLYIVLLYILGFFWRKKFSYFLLANMFTIFLVVINIKKSLQQALQKGIIFYNISPHTALSLVDGKHSICLIDAKLKEFNKQHLYHIKPHQLAKGITRNDVVTLGEVIKNYKMPWKSWKDMQIGCWKGKTIIYINKSFNYITTEFTEKIHVNFLIIEENSVQNLERVLKSFTCDVLVIGASNSKTVAAKLLRQSRQLGINSHSLHHQGALETYW